MTCREKDKTAGCKAIMFLETGSDVGKSIATTAFCRILKRRGVRVAPFKAQNMSNNSYVTAEGGEIGRAQVVQAEAAGLLPSVDMNPILLKPSTGVGAQVVLLGKVYAQLDAMDYHLLKPRLRSDYRQLSPHEPSGKETHSWISDQQVPWGPRPIFQRRGIYREADMPAGAGNGPLLPPDHH